MIKYITAIIILLSLSLTATACVTPSDPVDTPPSDAAEDVVRPGIPDSSGGDAGEDNADEQDLQNQIDLQEVKPNEAGKIMVLMYHVIGESEGEWSRRWDNFRKDLEVLYEKGYRLVSLKDYIANNIDVEAGYTPVVLTFDDGTQGQFNIIEQDGSLTVDPKSAVGIMENFHEEQPDFGLAATFFVYYPVPFRQKELIGYKFEYLAEKGMDIGNHSYGHANLATLNADQLQYQLGKMVAETEKYLPGYSINSLALPYGANAREEYREYIYEGAFEGTRYQNDAVLLVGSNPAPSPVDMKFDPRKLPRIRATDDPAINTDMYDWMDYFEENPHDRYISDGNPGTVSVPREMEDRVDKNRLGDKKLNIYDLE
jgi:peptidoglycan/xylan/chitin deacetylase (PgdA/CDA1 family)